MIKNRISYILALIGSVIFYVAYDEWIAMIILAAVIMLPLLSLLLSAEAILKTRITLDVPERVTQGTEARIVADAHCPTGSPHYKCKIDIKKPITGEEWVAYPRDALPSEHCGSLIVSAANTVVYDYLGLFGFKLRRAPSAIVRVMPARTALPIPEEFKGILARSMRAKHGGGFSEHHEIRPYRDGDTLNLIHWKLSAKADELMLREPMEPDTGIILLTVDINGTPDELDRKLSRIFCYGGFLLEHGIPFEIFAMTANGMENWLIREESNFVTCTDALLCAPFASKSIAEEHKTNALWRYHVGGEPYEA